ncbi:HET-C-related protein [Chitinophagaceae bacterium MMS25-I14]
MSQTLIFPTDATDKGTVLDAGTNTGGLTIDGKPVCVLGSKASHPQGTDTLLFCSSGITLDGTPLALSGGSTALGAQQLPGAAIKIDVSSGSSASGNAAAPKIVGDPIQKFEQDTLKSTLAHDAFLKFAKNTDEYFFCWHLLCIFGAGPGIDAFRKLYKEAKNGSLKNPPIYTIANPVLKYAGFSWQGMCIYVNRDFILFAAQPLPEDKPDTAEVTNSEYDTNIWLSRVRLTAALVEEYGEYIYRYLWKLAGKDPQNAGYDAGATYSFNVLDSIVPEQQMEILSGTVTRKNVDIKLPFSWWYHHIEEIKNANEGEDARAQDGEAKTSEGETIKKFGEGDGDVEHQRYHHGGIQKEGLKEVFKDEEKLLKLYYGNWLRDVSQAIDRLLLKTSRSIGGDKGIVAGKNMWIKLMELKGTYEFVMKPLKDDFKEVWEIIKTPEYIFITDELKKKVVNGARFLYYIFHFNKARQVLKDDFGDIYASIGCYRSEEHIDNPHEIEYAKDLVHFANLQTDADLENDMQCRLLQLNKDWYMKNYIRDGADAAGGTVGIGPTITAAAFIKAKLTEACSKGDTKEGRLALGAALHTLQDYYAHSNYCEILLLGVGYRNVFPWVDTNRESIPADFEIKEPYYTFYETSKTPVKEVKRLVTGFCIEPVNPPAQPRPKSGSGRGAGRNGDGPVSEIIVNTLPLLHKKTYPAVAAIQPDRLDSYKMGEDYTFNTDNTDNNIYVPEWINTDDQYNYAKQMMEADPVRSKNFRLHVLQELVVYNDGTAIYDLYEPRDINGKKLVHYPPGTIMHQEVLEKVTVYKYNPYRIPVVTGKFGSLDAIHSLADIVTEKLTPASPGEELLDKLLESVEDLLDDLIKDAKKEGKEKQHEGAEVKIIESLFEKVGGEEDEISFQLGVLLDMVATFVEETGGKLDTGNRDEIKKTVKEVKTVNDENQKKLKEALAKALHYLRKLSTLNKKELRKLLKSIKDIRTYYALIQKFLLKLLPMMLGYVTAWITKVISGAIETFQNYANSFMKKYGHLLDQKTVHSYGLFTNPTHSQLAKDDFEKPLHGLAGHLAIFATNKIGLLIDSCWKGQGGTAQQVTDAALQFITHPLDARNQFMKEAGGIFESVVKPWAVANGDKIEEASKPEVRQWIIRSLGALLKAYQSLKEALSAIKGKVLEMMKYLDQKLDDIKNAFDEFERSMEKNIEEIKKNIEQMQEQSIRQLEGLIQQLTAKMNAEMRATDDANSLQSLRQTNRQQRAASYVEAINYCKAEIAALKDIDAGRTIAVLNKWYERRYRQHVAVLQAEVKVWG